MAINFPTSLDALTNPLSTDYLNSPSHAAQHANANDAIEALEAKVGINSSADQESIDYKISHMMSLLNPIGTIREFNVSTNPGTLLGIGTWSAYGTGRVTIAIDAGQTEFDTVDETGGAKTHTLTISQIPNVTGSITMHSGETATNIAAVVGCFSSGLTNANNYRDGGTNNSGASSIGVVNFSLGGGGGSHNNLQPYIVVYRWVRTA